MRDSLLKIAAPLAGLLVLFAADWLWFGRAPGPTFEAPSTAAPPRTAASAGAGAKRAEALGPESSAGAGAQASPAAPRGERGDELPRAERGEEQRLAAEIVEHVRLGRIGHARALTDRFYRAYPNSSEIRQLERLTGYHPRPFGPATPAR